MSRSIEGPKAKTVYLDSANWFNLTDDNESGKKFALAVRNGSIAPVLSFIHVLEFGNRDEPYRSSATAYIDSIDSLCPTQWIRGLPAIVDAEVKNAFLSMLRLPPVPMSPFMDHLVDVLETKISWFDSVGARTCSFGEIVRLSSSLKSQERYQAFKRSSPVFDIARLRGLRKKNPTGYLLKDISEYAADILGDRVKSRNGVLIDVTDDLRAQFKKSFNLDHCPGLANKLAFFDGWSQSSGGETPSMFEDLFHLGAVSYCDEVFVDGGTWEALKKGKAPKLPFANRDFNIWLNRLPRSGEGRVL